MAINPTNTLRMTSLNSGLDTEAMVEAMTANTKLKINTQNRKAISLKWKQEGYQDVISKLTGFQKKFLDTLNQKTNMKSKNLFSQYSSKTTMKVNGMVTEGTPVGITVSSDGTAQASNFDVKINKAATQTVYSGAKLDASKLDLSNYQNSSETYTFKLDVGGKESTIVFKGSTNGSDIINDINSQLKDAYGENNVGSGMVQMDSTGKLSSTDKASMSMSGVMDLKGATQLSLNGIEQGTNTLTLQIGKETKTITFDTYTAEYLAGRNDPDNKDKEDIKTLYDNIASAMFTDDQYKKYNQDIADGTTTTAEIMQNAVQKLTDECNAAHDYEYEVAKMEAEALYIDELRTKFVDGLADGTIAGGTDFSDWKDLQPGFDETAFSVEFEADFTQYVADSISDFENNTSAADAYVYLHEDEKETYINALNDSDVADFSNKSNLYTNIEKASFSDGVKLLVSDSGEVTAVVEDEHGNVSPALDGDGNVMGVAITAATGSTNNFGVVEASSTASQITTATKLSELGFSGENTFVINGKSFTFDGDITIRTMMNEINTSEALNKRGKAVQMTYSTLTNSFTLASKDYGTDSEIQISADPGSSGADLISKLGLTSGTMELGTNMELVVNGQNVEVSSNSYKVDGTTFTATKEAEGVEFSTAIERDYEPAKEVIKTFVEEYNKLLEEVFEYVDKKPDKDYYPLTDSDLDDLDLSDKQEEKWEAKAKEGLLYNDSAIQSVMQKLRGCLYETISLGDGNTFGIFNMGITTSDDWMSHGMLKIDETKLEEALKTNADNIADLFAGTKKLADGTTKRYGIMHQLDSALTSAVKATGDRKDKGTLVQLAGLKTGTAATDNSIFDQLKSISQLVSNLEDRYEQQQERYWKQFSNLETLMGNLNSQQSYISQLFSF